MDSTKSCGLLDALIPGTEAHASYQERKREIEFDRMVEEQLTINPTFCILPDNFSEQ
jgi:hypothetical protein